MGWFGLALPEADGGSGLSAVEHALFYREVGPALRTESTSWRRASPPW